MRRRKGLSRKPVSVVIEKAIVGLGNPGSRYARTRHNVGFMVVDALAKRFFARLRRSAFGAKTARLLIEGYRVVLVKPMTYMNDSGRSVGQLVGGGHVGRDDTLIVLDDMALPLGALRMRVRGSAGSHNGLTSVLQTLGTDQIARLRIGIGPGETEDWKEFVLSPFSQSEYDTIKDAIERACDACLAWLRDGTEVAMSACNTPKKELSHNRLCVDDTSKTA